MKICITSIGDNLDAQVDPRFGRCAYFIFYDTDTDDFEVVQNTNVMAPSGAGIQSAQLVINKGAQVVITGNVGPNAFGIFNSAGITVITGVAGISVKEAIERFKSGQLNNPTSGPTVPGHFGMPGGAGFPGGGFGMGRGMGRRGGGFMPGFHSQAPGFGAPAGMSKEQELEFLKGQLEFLKQQIEAINKRIQELEGR